MAALGDGRLLLDNNLVERGIKPFVTGRKNFLFSDTLRGAEASAGIYSVVVTAKDNGLNPRKYAQWLLEAMPNAADPADPAPGLSGFPDAVVGIGSARHRAEAGGSREGRRDGRRPDNRHGPVGLLRRRKIENPRIFPKAHGKVLGAFSFLRGRFDAYEWCSRNKVNKSSPYR